MKVLHLLDTLNRGGAEMQALDVCRNARRFGIDLTLATMKGGAMEEDFRASGAEFVKLNRRFPVDIYLASQLRKIIKEREIEIVHGYQAVEGLHLYLATRGLKRVKRVLSFQGFLTDKKNRLALKFLIPRMDANIVVSRGLQKWHAEKDKLDAADFKIIYNGADAKRLKPAGKSLREELSLDKNSLLIGIVGNFYRAARKDQLTLCKALPRVFNEIPNAHCVFAGKIEPGAEDKAADCINFCIENKIIDRVHFLGARADVPDVLDALDVFVFSSLHEGLPVAVSEAMLAGVPMIVSDIEPLLEASAGGQYAEVFPVKNGVVLSEKILKLLKDESLRVDLAKRALEFARENFSIEAHLRELKKLYESL
ncbi:MAG TPA: glycosyltransferase [Pyrinomonadaceae bacterium]|jgi:glycosyltransferase involved in cell wall biosynthesis